MATPSRPGRSGWQWKCLRTPSMMVVLAVAFRTPAVAPATAALTPNMSQPDDPLQLDWSEWNQREVHPEIWEETDVIDPSCSRRCQQEQLRRLVLECSTRLEVPGLGCGDEMVTEDDFLVPLFYSRPSCGFEALPTKEFFEDIGRKYIFRFIGDSTTRRLAESFMSIVSGEGSSHPKAQERIDFSTDRLKVVFDWAPFCSGPLSVGEMLKTVMEEDEEEIAVPEEDADVVSDSSSSSSSSSISSSSNSSSSTLKRTVIITAFGIHDASYQLQVSQMNVKDWYRDQMPQDILKQDGFRAAALNACRNTTMQLVGAATVARHTVSTRNASFPPEEGEQKRPSEQGGGRRMRAAGNVRGQTRLLEAPTMVTPLLSVRTTNGSNIDVDSATEEVGAARPPPLVFLLQNNGYYNDPDDFQQSFLEEVHRIQRQEIGLGVEQDERDPALGEMPSLDEFNPKSDEDSVDTINISACNSTDKRGKGIFLVDSSVSLFKRLACYRIDPSSHYHEPAKLVEGKMLWNLFALVEGASSVPS